MEKLNNPPWEQICWFWDGLWPLIPLLSIQASTLDREAQPNDYKTCWYGKELKALTRICQFRGCSEVAKQRNTWNSFLFFAEPTGNVCCCEE